jgi:2-polyprenyl-3-methyl-5-hydroxy-6-metoxy-1,4-benzoquinol methylase
MTESKTCCLFCNSADFKESYLPTTVFNRKEFRYLSCNNCGLIYINPLPDVSDYVAMYPPSYQAGVKADILKNQYEKLLGLRYSYGYQFDLIKKFAPNGTMLDYGCGAANFLINANHHGIACDGAEFSPEHVAILRAQIPHRKFYLISDILSDENQEIKYDIIRLSNVLEHLDDPTKITSQLLNRLNPNGILLIEGPIETNFSLAFLSRKIYFSTRKLLQPSWKVSHTPTHIFFTNAKNQRDFFKRFPLEEIHFDITEAPWPYPNSWGEAQGVGGKVKALIAQFSMMVSKLFNNWGNTFIYVGRKKN